MRIVQIAPLEEPVPPRTYGGTELIVSNLVEEMTTLGHEVYLLGTGDSTTSGHLVPIVDQSLRLKYSSTEFAHWRNFLKIFHIPDILKQIKAIKPDIVHNHYAWRLVQFADFIDCPMYTTVHGDLSSPYEQYTFNRYKDENYISISDNQRKAMPDLNWVNTIYNGIQVDGFSLNKTKKRDYFAFLGRTSPEKGLKEICQMIKKTKYKLKIAAKVDAADSSYFNNEIKPLIDGTQIEFIGEVNHQQKGTFLKEAKGLLLWLNWEEPFGLVVIEAMACGTPVIVNPRGSMPEIIKSGKNGFLVKTIAEMQEKLDLVESINPQFCRTDVERRFSATRMAEEYLALAGKLTN